MKPAPAFALRLSPACPQGGRLGAIDRLKGFALLLVLLYHLGGMVGWDNGLHGETGVDVFLIVSGFLLALRSAEMPAGRFLLRRFLRIYPSYWIALGLYLWLDIRYFADVRPAADVALHFAGLHGFSRPEFFSSVNDSFWYVSMIVLLYVLFLCLRRRLRDFSLLVGVGGLLTVALCLGYRAMGNFGGMIHLGVRVPSAFVGLMAGQLAAGRPLEVRFNLPLAAGLLAATYLLIFQSIALVYPIAAAALIAGFLAVDTKLRRYHGGRAFLAVFSFLGVYSYEIYLLHQPAMRDFPKVVFANAWGVLSPSSGQLWAGRAVAFVLVLAASVGLHHATETVFRRLGRGRPAAAGGAR